MPYWLVIADLKVGNQVRSYRQSETVVRAGSSEDAQYYKKQYEFAEQMRKDALAKHKETGRKLREIHSDLCSLTRKYCQEQPARREFYVEVEEPLYEMIRDDFFE